MRTTVSRLRKSVIRMRFEKRRSVAGSEAGDVAAGGDIREIVLLAQTAVDVACDASSERAFDARAIAANQNRQRNFGMRFVSVSQKPADVRKLVGAGAS